MVVFDFTAEDVARGSILSPGWYTLEVSKVEDGIAKSSGNPKTTVSFKCLDGKDHEGNDVAGVPLTTTFSPGAPGFAIDFCNALGANIGKEGKAGVKIDSSIVGQKLRGFVKNEVYEGKTQNKVDGYQPLS